MNSLSLAERFADYRTMWSVDHGQLEIRVLAQASQDKLLIQLLQSGEDIHSAVGHELTGIPLAKIKDDRPTRTAIKGIHFGIIYGLSAHSLYLTLMLDAKKRREEAKKRGEPLEESMMSEEEVTDLYNKYFQKFHAVKEWIDAQVAFASKHGYVQSMFGFRREINTKGTDEDRETYWANQAVNSPIQGAAHTLILISLGILQTKRKTYKLLQDLTMEVHDSLVGFSPLWALPEVYVLARQLLEKDVLVYVREHWPEINWSVPLKSEMKCGFRLGVLEKYSGEPVSEFLPKWCEANEKFETSLKEQMAQAERG